MTPADDANVERLRAAIERFNAGDLDAYGAAFHDDCQRWFAGAPGPVGNASALVAVRDLRRAFSARSGRFVGRGVVTAVSGTLMTVRWDDGHVTTGLDPV
jgi:hypothetical protein